MNHFDDSFKLYNALEGRMFFDTEPYMEDNKPAEFPYCVWDYITTSDEFKMGPKHREHFDIQFLLISDSFGTTEILDLYDYLKEAYDFAEFDVDDHNLIWCQRTSNILQRMEGEPKTWQYAVRYRILLEEQ